MFVVTKPRVIELLLVTAIPAMLLADRGTVAPVLILNTLIGGVLAAAGANTLNCVADADTSPGKDAFRRFHAELYAQQPGEDASSFPTNAQLIEMARVAGVASQSLSDCINNGKYTAMVQGLVKATGINYTPTIRINGQEFVLSETTTPQDLINKVTQITGPIPGLAGPPPPAPSPPPPPPAPSPAPPPPPPNYVRGPYDVPQEVPYVVSQEPPYMARPPEPEPRFEPLHRPPPPPRPSPPRRRRASHRPTRGAGRRGDSP